jgi:DNA-binding MltR family transcriptional regulator
MQPDEPIEDFSALFQSLSNESSRAQVVILRGFIDELLKKILQKHIISDAMNNNDIKNLFSANGIFSSLSSRIVSCYSFGLLTGFEYELLQNFRKIRNAAAHRIKFEFSQSPINDLCQNFEIIYSKYLPEISFEDPPEPKLSYDFVMGRLFCVLSCKFHEVEQASAWPESGFKNEENFY